MVAIFADAERLRNGRDDQAGICHRGEVDEEYTVGEGFQHRRSDGKREARFPNASGTAQREQPHTRIKQALPCQGEFVLPAYQPGWL